MYTFRWLPALSVLLVLMLPACAPVAAPPADATPTTASTLTTRLAPTLTEEPTATDQPTPTEEPASWDLLFISNSTGLGVPDLYAEHIQSDLGVIVSVQNEVNNDLSAQVVLRRLGLENDPLTELIRGAEIIVLHVESRGSISEENPGRWICTSTLTASVEDCSLETFEQYRADLSQVYQAIFDLRGGESTIIRAYDSYNPWYEVYRNNDAFDACRACWQNFNQVIHEVSAEYNVPVAPVYAAFNGEDFTEDPAAKGYIAGDNVHTSGEGREVIAALLRDLGYELTEL